MESGRILLILEGESATNAGLYSVPGGRCEEGEPPAVCAIREAKEEAGVETIVVCEVANFYSRVAGNCFHGYLFESRIVSGIPRPCGGVKSVCWANLAQIEALEARGLMISGKLFEAVKCCLAKLK